MVKKRVKTVVQPAAVLLWAFSVLFNDATGTFLLSRPMDWNLEKKTVPIPTHGWFG